MDLFEAFSRRRLDNERVAEEVDRLESEFLITGSIDENTSPYFIKCVKTLLSKQDNTPLFFEGKMYPCKVRNKGFLMLIDELGRPHGITDDPVYGKMNHFENDNSQDD